MQQPREATLPMEKVSHLPDALLNSLRRCMETDPEDRYQTASEFASAIGRALPTAERLAAVDAGSGVPGDAIAARRGRPPPPNPRGCPRPDRRGLACAGSFGELGPLRADAVRPRPDEFWRRGRDPLAARRRRQASRWTCQRPCVSPRTAVLWSRLARARANVAGSDTGSGMPSRSRRARSGALERAPPRGSTSNDRSVGRSSLGSASRSAPSSLP